MQILLYDHTFDGFLSCVFHVYEYKLSKVQILKKGYYTSGFFDEVEEVYTDVAKASRVLDKLKTLVSQFGIQNLLYAFLSETSDVEVHLLATIQRILKHMDGNIITDFTDKHVLQISKLAKSVGREKHRMEAFVRFELFKDNIYSAVIYPDFDVLLLIKNHFFQRYKDQHWLIYDLKRNYGLYYDLTQVEVITLDTTDMIKDKTNLAGEEHLYQELWKEYFDHTNIVERKNLKLHVQHVPKRYWRYLTEKRL